MLGWSLNWDKTGCIHCLEEMPGCEVCESTRVRGSDQFYQCTDCHDDFEMVNDECRYDGG
jgi:hypothetical protein